MIKSLIIVNGWNCENLVGRCLQSIINQTNQNFSLVIVDDASEDKTNEKILNFYIPEEINIKTHLVTNQSNIGTARSRIKAQHEADLKGFDYEVVVWVDMDDQLTPNALGRVVKEYEDPKCWLTYGHLISASSGNAVIDKSELYFSDLCHTIRGYRYEPWKYVNLRSHRKKLIYHLTEEDIRSDVFLAYPDINMLYCMLEMAGKEHIRVIEDLIYIYTDYHDNVCIKRFSFQQRANEKHLVSKIIPKQNLLKL